MAPAPEFEARRGQIVLASASPRRRQLLEATGLGFLVEPADVDESFDTALQPEPASEMLADRKARAHGERWRGQRAWLIGSDTLVALPCGGPDPASDGRAGGPWRYLEKARDAAEARRFLGWLSGSTHRVVTGVSVFRVADGASFTGHATSVVRMRTLLASEIEAYVASGEWRGKAGGYAIQETADAFVESLEGGFDTVVGLPVRLTLELLRRAGAPVGDEPGLPR